MGTRHLIVGIVDGKTKLAQYGQWDGYPTGQGKAIAKIVGGKAGASRAEKIADNLRKSKFISDKQVGKLWKEEGADESGMVSFEIADKFKAKYPCLSRDTGADVLAYLKESPQKLNNSIKFAADSLFCEYAYVLDFDHKVLEIYKGFVKRKSEVKGRFEGLKREEGNEYYPVTLYETVKFTDLNSAYMEDLEERMNGAE